VDGSEGEPLNDDPNDERDDEMDDLRESGDDGDREPLPSGRPAPELRPHGDRLAGRRREASDRALDSGPDLAPARLLSFYDRLRVRISSFLERRGGRIGRPIADALLLVPDVFMLLVRLAFDREVPGPTRTLIGGALAYFVLPFDMLPEALVGAAGMVDDVVLAAAVLTQVMSPELEERVRRYWSGRDDVRRALQDIAGTAHSLLGENLFGRMRALLARRGVVLERPPQTGARAVDTGEGDEDEELAAAGDVGRSPYH
jgi:uncharacterized membrane protein YkvA (DUF1232 family)